VLSGLFLMALAALIYRAQPLFINVSAVNTIIVTSIVAFAGLAVVIVSLTSAWRSGPGMLAVAAAMTFAALPYAALPASADATVVQMAQRVKAVYQGESIGTYRVLVRNLVFYTGLKHTDIIHDEHLQDWLAKNPRALIVMTSTDADRLAAGGLAMQRLAQLPYFNDSVIKVRTLLWPDRATDLETVVLVRIP
jgi:hypothetical protein